VTSDIPTGLKPTQPPSDPQDEIVENLRPADIDGQPAGADPGQESDVPSQGDSILQGEHLVDWGGVRRKVKIGDLVEAARKGESLEQRERALDEKLQQMAQQTALLQKLDSLEPPQAQMLGYLLQDPSRLSALAQAPQPASPPAEAEDEDNLDDLISGHKKRGGKMTPEMQQLLQRMAQMERTTAQLHRFANDELGKRHEQTRKQRVEEVMGSFPVFGESPALHKLALDHILTSLTTNPSQSIDDLVATVARDTHPIAEQLRSGVVEERTGRTSPSQDLIPGLEDRRFTGDEMQSGKMLDELSRMLG